MVYLTKTKRFLADDGRNILLLATGPKRRVNSRVKIDVLKTVYDLSLKTNPIPEFHLILLGFKVHGLYCI